ncbi:DUF599 domain-containing protein [Amaricoccus tamworthensis]|uniref:DUF599 domain-containing protein n=1 Tax=Amaricoccus tamworthensis TaxID=57002 RepID=UPI003C7D2E37
MTIVDIFGYFAPLDFAAVGFVLVSWLGMSWRIETSSFGRPSVTVLMVRYRREWMRQMVTREPRIFDATILSNLRQGTAFFASGCMIALGGVLALLGNTESLNKVAVDLSVIEAPEYVWRIKLLLVALLLTHGFLKFVWSNRLFGYCAVLMGAVPNDLEHPQVYDRAAQAAEINIRAAWNFNRGLRAVYYSLGALAWLLGPLFLIASTVVVNVTIWNREFSSKPRDILENDAAP